MDDGSTTPKHLPHRSAIGTPVLRSVVAIAVATVALVGLGPTGATASTSNLRGVNWADQRDNFVNGTLYVSGLSASDSYSTASATGDAVVGQLYAATGGNTVRMPVNEPTVANYWNTYTGAIDAALAKGNVILAYWAYTGGKPPNTGAFNTMWDKIVAKYGSNSRAYFEVINEPYGLGTGDLNNLYNTWLNRYPSVSRGRVILDGAGLATNVPAVGNDSRLNGTLLAVHDYSFFVTPPYDSENQWSNHLNASIGTFADRTVSTEWGGPMGPGSKYDVQWDTMDYSVPSGSWFADYIRGVSSRLRSNGMGSIYWPGLRDGDWYSLTKRSGTGSSTRLSVVNPSGIDRLRYAWGLDGDTVSAVGLRNTGNGQYVDGLGGAASGSVVGTGADATSPDRQWVVENDGDYVRLKNRATGLYLDGLGRTSSGSALGQYASSTSANQRWSVLTDANNVRIKNRATGLFLQAGNGGLSQNSDSSSTAQRWKILSAGPPITPTTPTTTTAPPTTTPATTSPTTGPTTTTTAPTTTTSGPAVGCQVSFTPNAWSSGFTVDVKVTNTSSQAIDGWTVGFTLPSGQAVTSAWNATLTGSTGAVKATNLAYNASLPAGGSAQFGFQGTLSGTYGPPTAATLNGTSCTVA
jgi:Cellulose binding domain/Cellulase (glycosyl hydrolase family 5)/Ricin-type beta-trefoil lectin domain-like